MRYIVIINLSGLKYYYNSRIYRNFIKYNKPLKGKLKWKQSLLIKDSSKTS